MGNEKLIFEAGEVCPNIECEFRNESANSKDLCFGAQAGRKHRFVCDLEALKKLYHSHKK